MTDGDEPPHKYTQRYTQQQQRQAARFYLSP